MNEGAVIVKGRNNNRLILDKEGGVKINTGNSSIIVNSPNIPQPLSVPPVNSTFSIPKLNSTKSLSTDPTDVIPSYYPTKSISITSISSISITVDTSSLFLPETEETFTILYNENFINDPSNILFTSDPLLNPASNTGKKILFSGNVSAVIKTSPITKDTKDFATVTRQVIAYLEGGYFNPKTHAIGDPTYKNSGETMFGIDRVAGAPNSAGPENPRAPASAKEFWTKIDNTQRTEGNWRYLYIPPNPLQDELVNLTIKIIKPEFDRLLRKHYKPEIISIIESDGRLLFNVIYAVWNGSGWFESLAKELTIYYGAGNKTAESLTQWFVNRRIDPTGLQVQGYKIKRGDDNWILFNKGGLKIRKLIYGQ